MLVPIKNWQSLWGEAQYVGPLWIEKPIPAACLSLSLSLSLRPGQAGPLSIQDCATPQPSNRFLGPVMMLYYIGLSLSLSLLAATRPLSGGRGG